MDKITAARTLLRTERRQLRTAISLRKRSSLGRRSIPLLRALLRRVSHFERGMHRDPEFHAHFALGFMGENGWQHLIRREFRAAQRMGR